MLAYRIHLDETIKIEEYLETFVSELVNYKQFIEKQSSGEAHLIVETNSSLLKIGEKNFYPVYVGEQWDDHRVNWEWFYVSEQMDEILWYNLVDDEFKRAFGLFRECIEGLEKIPQQWKCIWQP